MASPPFAARLPPCQLPAFHPMGLSGHRRDHALPLPATLICATRKLPGGGAGEGSQRGNACGSFSTNRVAWRAAVTKARPLDVASLNCLWHGSAMAKLERRAIEPAQLPVSVAG